MLLSERTEIRLLLYSSRSELPFSAAADQELTVKIAVHNTWDDRFVGRVGFGVDKDSVSLHEFDMPPKTMRRATVSGLSLRKLMDAIGKEVPAPNEHIRALWLVASKRADGNFIIDDVIVRKLIVLEDPQEGEFPLWVIPAVGGGIIALGVAVQLLEKKR